MESFELAFDATNKGPICNDVVIVSDDVYEGEEVLTFNLTTGDSAVILEPDSGVLVIQDDDGKSCTLQQIHECIMAI